MAGRKREDQGDDQNINDGFERISHVFGDVPSFEEIARILCGWVVICCAWCGLSSFHGFFSSFNEGVTYTQKIRLATTVGGLKWEPISRDLHAMMSDVI